MRLPDGSHLVLPELEEGGEEARVTSDDALLIYLKEYGCLLRVSQISHVDHQHEEDRPLDMQVWEGLNECLQPLLYRETHGARVEIYPAIYHLTRHQDLELLEGSLERQGVAFRDNEWRNAMEVRWEGNGRICRQALVVDRGSLALADGNMLSIVSAQENGRGIQQALFGELTAAFEKAWPVAKRSPDSRPMQMAFALCREYVQRGLLNADISREAKDADAIELAEAADRYHAHCSSI